LSKAVRFKGKSEHFHLHPVAAKTKLLQITSFSLICQKQAHGRENWKGVVEKSCSLYDEMSLLDVALVSLKSVGDSTRRWSCYDTPLLDEISYFWRRNVSMR